MRRARCSRVTAVGHGLAVVIHTPGDQVLLYDCGRMGDPSVGRRIIAPALWSRGLSRIDEVILSHADQDHYNGLPDLLDRFAIGMVRVRACTALCAALKLTIITSGLMLTNSAA